MYNVVVDVYYIIITRCCFPLLPLIMIYINIYVCVCPTRDTTPCARSRRPSAGARRPTDRDTGRHAREPRSLGRSFVRSVARSPTAAAALERERGTRDHGVHNTIRAGIVMFRARRRPTGHCVQWPRSRAAAAGRAG